MSTREYRRFTAEQKIEILREADQPGVTVSEVCRRHGLAPSVLYRWRAVAQGGQRAIRLPPRPLFGLSYDLHHRRFRLRRDSG